MTELERIPVKNLNRADTCPICANPFLDGKYIMFNIVLSLNLFNILKLTLSTLTDPYPLIVRLPCNPLHIYDLECIAPWLKLHATCPLDRIDLLQGKRTREEDARRRMKEKREGQDDGDDDDDEAGMYA
jgi:hypothetical protein